MNNKLIDSYVRLDITIKNCLSEMAECGYIKHEDKDILYRLVKRESDVFVWIPIRNLMENRLQTEDEVALRMLREMCYRQFFSEKREEQYCTNKKEVYDYLGFGDSKELSMLANLIWYAFVTCDNADGFEFMNDGPLLVGNMILMPQVKELVGKIFVNLFDNIYSEYQKIEDRSKNSLFGKREKTMRTDKKQSTPVDLREQVAAFVEEPQDLDWTHKFSPAVFTTIILAIVICWIGAWTSDMVSTVFLLWLSVILVFWCHHLSHLEKVNKNRIALEKRIEKEQVSVLTLQKTIDELNGKEGPWTEDISDYPRFDFSIWAYMTDEDREKSVDSYINSVRAYAYSDIARQFGESADENASADLLAFEEKQVEWRETIRQDQEEIARLSGNLRDAQSSIKRLTGENERYKKEILQMQKNSIYGSEEAGERNEDPIPHKYCPCCGLRNADDAEICRECEHDFTSDASVRRIGDIASSYAYWLSPKYDTGFQRARKKSAKRVLLERYDPDTQRAFVRSEKDEGTYITTYRYCTCWDFRTRELPCKHMYAVMMHLGVIPPQ